MARLQILTQLAPAPFKYPAAFHITENNDYVKYRQKVFEDRSARGDDYWTAENITQTWYQAETGKIPISGAGYGGKFAGESFENIWLDMSEIVHPTGDGIHDREIITTAVELGHLPSALEFDAGGNLVSSLLSPRTGALVQGPAGRHRTRFCLLSAGGAGGWRRRYAPDPGPAAHVTGTGPYRAPTRRHDGVSRGPVRWRL